MPTFDFTDPSGKSYSVDGPDGATPEQAFKILQDHLGGDSKPQIGIGEDLANVAKAAPGRMLAGVAGIPGDLATLNMKLAGRTATPDVGSEGIAKALGSEYQAQSEPGRLAQKAVDFAPALIGGPEALGAKLLTRVAAPAVASEIGGAVGGPMGELAGALGGAAGATAAARKFQAMAAARGGAVVPDVAELKAAARAQYQHPDVKDVQIKPEALDDLATKIEKDLQFGPNSGFRSANEPRVFNAVNELRSPVQRDVGPASLGAATPELDAANTTLANIFNKATGDKHIAVGPANIDDIDSVRQLLNNLSKERDGAGQLTRQAVAANRAIGHIDSFLPNLNQADLVSGNASRANSILGQARSNWGSAKRAENVQNLAANAEINAASANSGANIQNATKQAFKPMLKNNAAKAYGYNDEELKALNDVVRGTWSGSAARAAGNLLGGGGGLGMLASGAVGYHEGGVGGAIAAGLAGRGLKMIGNRSTFNAVQKLDTLIRSRSPEAIRIAAQNPQIAAVLPPRQIQALRTMILADPTLRAAQQQSQPVS